MDINIFSQAFEQVGLAATVIGILTLYLSKLYKEKAEADKEMREVFFKTLEKSNSVNEIQLQTNKELAEANRLMLNEFGSKINNIENNIIEIKHKISN